ncbi:MAG: HAD hydrolase family protein [Deltaproteobacteria bacterium]|nr:HAD hydrolase family protein [Deltaproteobacteria bacterium]
MTIEEIAELTSLDTKSASLAKQREFDEPFVFSGDETEIPAMTEAAESMGLRITEGRFHHLIGNSDKGRAVEMLVEILSAKLRDPVTIGIGDGRNDMEMLEKVNYSVVVRQADGGIHPALSTKGFILSDAAGPAGFSSSIIGLIKKLGR